LQMARYQKGAKQPERESHRPGSHHDYGWTSKLIIIA
jgi:hypothetical protein